MEQTFDHGTSSKLYILNPTNGNKTLVVDMQTTNSFHNLIFKAEKIIGATNIDGGNISQLYTIDLENKSFSSVNLNENSNVDFELVN